MFFRGLSRHGRARTTFGEKIFFVTVFCFLTEKQKTENPIFRFGTTIVKKFEISVFICANPRQNRPAPSVNKNSRSWALLLVHHWEMDQNHVILAAVWSMSALPPLVILSAHFETAVTFFLRFDLAKSFFMPSAFARALWSRRPRVAKTRAPGARGR